MISALSFSQIPSLHADTVATEGLVNYETPHVHPIDLTPDGTTLLAVNTAGHTLEMFDVSGSTVTLIDTIAVGIDPVTVRARSNTEAWVVNHVSDSVSIVDLEKRVVIRTIPTGNEPCDVVFAGNPQRAFVSCSEVNRVEVFDPANPAAAPVRVPIGGEDPRALAVSPDGSRVYVAIFESGNGTTAISGGGSVTSSNVVSRPEGPYAGQNPPPNNGNAFKPTINPALPAAPTTAMIVRKDAANRWFDDNNRNWSIFVNGALSSLTGRVANWDLLDQDVAEINTATLAVTYRSRLMNMVMALGVNPATGAITAVGTESTNEIRFEPNLNGTFVRVNAATFPSGTGATRIDDLNPHLDYTTPTVPPAIRQQSIGDPRGIAWQADGLRAFVTGMGSNNVAVIDPSGNRVAHFQVGEGPTGIVLDDGSGRGFVMNKFSGTISVIDLAGFTVTATAAFNDPTPAVIKEGRPFLYNTHLSSGLGQVSCASCHVDARTDRLSWDLGDPRGAMATVLNGNNSNGNTQGTTTVHPMKGPMLTQTLQDISKYDRLHWRGDRANLAGFNPTFTGLMGAERQLSAAEMQKFGAFLATIHLPPNPYRNIDNTRPSSITLPDGSVARTTTFNALRGQNSRGNNCLQCHMNGDTRNDASNLELSQAFIAPSFAPFYDRLGYWPGSRTGSLSGFGFFHDGADSIGGAARTTTAERQTDMLAEILTLEGPGGPLTGPEVRQDTHAGAGQQETVTGTASAATLSRINQMISIANGSPHVELIVRGRIRGVPRGFLLVSGTNFNSDRQGRPATLNELLAEAAAGHPLTFTLVPNGVGNRLAIDTNRNSLPDGDEPSRLDDPANLLTNGGFESGLTNWDNGGDVSVATSTPRTGDRSVRVGTASYLVQSIPTVAGQNYLCEGWYFTNGTLSSLEAGLSFWDAQGEWVADRIISLDPATPYAPFRNAITAPTRATSVSVWILTGEGGGVTVDNLVFKPGGNGDGGGDTNNLLTNGGFEQGIPPWDTGGTNVFLSPAASEGTRAARLGGAAFVVQTMDVTPGRSIALDGAYFSSGSSELMETGFSFWDASGTWIEDRTVVLGPSATYRDFRVEATAPANAAIMTIWAWNGAGGELTLDELRLELTETAENELFTNGGFESGGLAAWDTGGSDVTTAGDARTGAAAALIGANSFIVHNRATSDGEVFRMSGFYKTNGGEGALYEAGFSFWSGSGEWLGDGAIQLGSATTYAPFEVVATAPGGATALSAWVFSPQTGRITVDDLSLVRLSAGTATETGSEDLAQSTTLENRARSRTMLKNRELGGLFDPELDRVQPDLIVKGVKGAYIGNDIYNLTGQYQKAINGAVKSPMETSFRIMVGNDAVAWPDEARLIGTRSSRHFEVEYYRLARGRENVTAAVTAGTHLTSKQKAGAVTSYLAVVKQSQRSRLKAFKGRLEAASALHPVRTDAVLFDINLKGKK